MMNPNMPVSIMLTIQQWNAVLVALMDAPYRVASPLINAIGEQARAAEASAALQVVQQGNGEAHTDASH